MHKAQKLLKQQLHSLTSPLGGDSTSLCLVIFYVHTAGAPVLLSPLLSLARFIRLRDNPSKRKEERDPKKETKKRERWREQEVKDSGEKEFIETYISSLKERGENQHCFNVDIKTLFLHILS